MVHVFVRNEDGQTELGSLLIPDSLGILPPMLRVFRIKGDTMELSTLDELKQKNDRPKRYAHFDKRVSLATAWGYVTNPERVAHHAFYPFIHYTKTIYKFDKQENKRKPKTREIRYSAHIDRCIYQYYGALLNEKYYERLKQDGLSHVAIAYRSDLHKNNLHFAKDAFDFIRCVSDCYIIVGDFTNFFDTLQHRYLKQRLVDFLGAKLPPDYYALFKNITQYSSWDLDDLIQLNGLEGEKSKYKKLNSREQVLPPEKFKQYKATHASPNRSGCGIPQGSAISAVLSNIYMLAFDKVLNNYVQGLSGLYMRYCDDFIIVLPNDGRAAFEKQLAFIRDTVEQIPNLQLEPRKTQVFSFCSGTLLSENQTFGQGENNGHNILNYLGLAFNGQRISLRDKTISKYYNRMYRKAKTIIRQGGISPKGNRITGKELYKRYSYKGAKGFDRKTKKPLRNFISYVQRAEKIFGPDEAVDLVGKRHMQKISKRLKVIK